MNNWHEPYMLDTASHFDSPSLYHSRSLMRYLYPVFFQTTNSVMAL